MSGKHRDPNVPYTEISERGQLMEKEAVTTDDLIEQLFQKRTWKYTLLILSLPLSCLAGPPAVFVSYFAGLISRDL